MSGAGVGWGLRTPWRWDRRQQRRQQHERWGLVRAMPLAVGAAAAAAAWADGAFLRGSGHGDAGALPAAAADSATADVLWTLDGREAGAEAAICSRSGYSAVGSAQLTADLPAETELRGGGRGGAARAVGAAAAPGGGWGCSGRCGRRDGRGGSGAAAYRLPVAGGDAEGAVCSGRERSLGWGTEPWLERRACGGTDSGCGGQLWRAVDSRASWTRQPGTQRGSGGGWAWGICWLRIAGLGVASSDRVRYYACERLVRQRGRVCFGVQHGLQHDVQDCSTCGALVSS